MPQAVRPAITYPCDATQPLETLPSSSVSKREYTTVTSERVTLERVSQAIAHHNPTALITFAVCYPQVPRVHINITPRERGCLAYP